ncbi:hypothetical protein Vadar_001067 [Vaccinium darrowii]|uniref:Uncharacterized protein n=1 Tax=Vaccinium darrowii TaxID=229202 RepID=A0ACB7XMB5_9ERIC|nr:hypothetical protein Vadar_001067 [Vaccinium darrowii]
MPLILAPGVTHRVWMGPSVPSRDGARLTLSSTLNQPEITTEPRVTCTTFKDLFSSLKGSAKDGWVKQVHSKSNTTTVMEQHIAKVSDKMNTFSATFVTRVAIPSFLGLVSNPPGIVNAAAKVTVAMSVATKMMVFINGLKSASTAQPYLLVYYPPPMKDRFYYLLPQHFELEDDYCSGLYHSPQQEPYRLV